MQTSYFYLSGDHENAVSIARQSPSFYKGKEYLKLAPTWEMVSNYRQDKNKEDYIHAYKEEVLNQLDPQKVKDELPDNAILLCFENPNKFCHRQLVAEWLEENLGIEVTEVPRN